MKNENTITIDIHLTRRLLALLVLALLIVAGLGYLAWGHDEVSASASSASLASSDGMRQYYLTSAVHSGSLPDDVCATGYHFASLWEVLDPSNLKYNTTLGTTDREDSGQGPPSNLSGWIRTGYDGSTSSTPGMGNCWLWDFGTSSYRGTYATLPSEWTADTDVHVWITGNSHCGTYHRAWCVED